VAVKGIGVDAVEIARVERACSRTPGLLGRLFTERERAHCTTRCGDLRFGGLAGRFAAKEAVAKAFGTGLRGFGWRDVEVLADELGRPAVTLHGNAASLAQRLGAERIHCSISHTADLAIAQVVLEGQ
jgi:holo-[acyl-carrier protein] synthase